MQSSCNKARYFAATPANIGDKRMTFLIHWLIRAVAIVITAYLLPGVKLSGFGAALFTALVLGFINTFIKPLLLLLTLPLNILTLGLFTFVINALLILITSALVPGFVVTGFGWALVFSLVLSIINYVLGVIVF
jgi:putative membrane protein